MSMSQIIAYPDDLVQKPDGSGLKTYGQYLVMSIYQPEQVDINVESNYAILGAVGTLSLPFLINAVGAPPAANAALSEVAFYEANNALVGGENFGLSDVQRFQQFPTTAGRIFAAATNTLYKQASRLSETRASLGLGLSYTKMNQSIALPMPSSIKTNYGFEYSDEDFSTQKLFNVARTLVRDKMKQTTITDPRDAQGLYNFLATVPGSVFDASFNLLGLKSNLAAYTRANRNAAKIPYVEKIFNQVKRRSFELDYVFMPRSQKEVLTLREVLKQLKKHAHPRKSKNDNYFYTTPSEFTINFEFMGTTNHFLPKFGRLAMDSIDVEYGSSDGYSSLRPIRDSDGLLVSTTEISVKMTFTELELLTSERIEEGY